MQGYYLSEEDASKLADMGDLVGLPLRSWLLDRQQSSFVRRLQDESDFGARMADELDSTYRHVRAVIENCKHSSLEMIRHQLVGLLPEAQEIEPAIAERMVENGLDHLVDRQAEIVRLTWEAYGYGQAAS